MITLRKSVPEPLPYSRPYFLINRHFETIFPALFRNVVTRPFTRERISTPDHDFLDLDWIHSGSTKLVILSHGLEGNSQRAYIKGMAKIFSQHQFDVLAWNYRGCSEEMNKTIRFYHSGATDDLHTVVEHARNRYPEIYLVGFSLGGNLTLKYLGEQHHQSKIKRAVVFSVPLNLYTSCLQISKPGNWIYSQRFLRSLKKKISSKARVMSGLNTAHLNSINSLIEFDDEYTAPLHGFAGAIDYYNRCSAIHFIDSITTPTLIVNAKNDPFLSKDCYPDQSINTNVLFEFPEHGGHVGFSQFNQNGLYWSELRALHFITND